jgi:hypothetical protein
MYLRSLGFRKPFRFKRAKKGKISADPNQK